MFIKLGRLKFCNLKKFNAVEIKAYSFATIYIGAKNIDNIINIDIKKKNLFLNKLITINLKILFYFLFLEIKYASIS